MYQTLYGTRLFYKPVRRLLSVHKTKNAMSFNYKLPKVGAERGAFITTPLPADTVLSQGELTLKNEDGVDALTVRIFDIIGWKYDAFTAGTANSKNVDFTGATLIGNNLYSLTVDLPYLVNFFGGGGHATADARESEAVYTARTYKVATDATPTATELSDAFKAVIDADINAAFSAVSIAGVLRLTADSASAGSMDISTSAPGAVVADGIPWVSPVGTTDEAQDELGVALAGAGYNRYVIEFREPIRHNAVKGLRAIKNTVFVYYIDKDDAETATAVALLTSILNGSYATVADYLGAPNA